MKQATTINPEHCASARSRDVPISTKHSVELSNYLRYHSVAFAKDFLEDVVALKKAVPFNRYRKDVGHKPGMAAGRFPQKAAKEFLKLIKGVEANAQSKGLNAGSLKIVKLLANKASVPFSGGRQRHATKRSHLEVVVQEMKKAAKKKAAEKRSEKGSAEKGSEEKPAVVEKPTVKNEEKKEEAAEVKAAPVVKEAKSEAAKTESKPAPAARPAVKETPIPTPTPKMTSKETVKAAPQQLSPEDLLKQAQKKAAEFNQKEKDQKAVDQVSNLYEKLKQDGTLRGDKK
ncbi:50S ribosomal protein L22 [Candidatus Woesearchaeota archaeon CG10_big_fil_rev_8_21_14_0_10_45_16]|nr:MAG: 50S ribosomal protein L22 [Candidatus Woesearchaeota archaeon CG10_big_fil_rev_8_21_14_0_10_45_16]